MSGAVCVWGCVDFVSRRLLEHVLVEDDERIHGVTADGGGQLAITRQRDKECLDLLFAMAEGVPLDCMLWERTWHLTQSR